MTVAPSRLDTLPPYSKILTTLTACQQTVRQTGTAQVASLTFSLPFLDPLSALLSLKNTSERQCYLESPARGQAIAAWDVLLSEDFSGSDRFRAAQAYLARWQGRICCAAPLPEGPYFFCSFSFLDTIADTTAGYAPATVLLTRWQVVRHRTRCTLIANTLIEPDTALAPEAAMISQQLHRLRSQPPASLEAVPQPWGHFQSRLPPADTDALQGRIVQTLAAIRAGRLQKQVVAHALDVSRELPFDRAVALSRLRSRHPDCYIFSFSGMVPDTHFIGASPERLLSIHQGQLVIDALAGSAPRGANTREDRILGQRLLNNPKEQREHQLVLDFILQQLQMQGLSPRYCRPPSLLRLSNIQHLHTPVSATLDNHCARLPLVKALHPTPAMAGIPTEVACEFIRREEPHGRGLYAAPFGWIDPQGNSEFIVGIRSALIRGNQARLYAGAGIVAGSDPEKELDEIQLKLQALLEALE